MSDFFVDWFLLLCRKLFGLISFVCFLLFLVFWGAYPKRHCLDWSFKGFAYIFRVLDLKFLSLAHFEVTSTQWGLGINYESSSCGHPIFLVPFMKLSIYAFPRTCFGHPWGAPPGCVHVDLLWTLHSAWPSTWSFLCESRVVGVTLALQCVLKSGVVLSPAHPFC